MTAVDGLLIVLPATKYHEFLHSRMRHLLFTPGLAVKVAQTKYVPNHTTRQSPTGIAIRTAPYVYCCIGCAHLCVVASHGFILCCHRRPSLRDVHGLEVLYHMMARIDFVRQLDTVLKRQLSRVVHFKKYLAGETGTQAHEHTCPAD